MTSSVVYQLVAHGESENGHSFKMRSKEIFKTKELALDFIDTFRERCTSDEFLNQATPDGLIIKVCELPFII